MEFAAGADTATIEVPVQGDTDVEPDEDFLVTLSDPTNATLGNAEGDATILNDDADMVDGALTIWTNGGQVLIDGDAFEIGTIGAAAANDLWTEDGSSDAWSEGANWDDGTPPVPADGAVFAALGSGGTNIVDANFEIASLEYTGEGSHTLDLAGSNVLEVSNDVTLLAAAPALRHTLIVQEGAEIIATVAAIRIGYSDAGSEAVSGNVVLDTGSSLDASVAGTLSIGETAGPGAFASSGGDADGSLTVGSNTVLRLGAPGAPASLLNIGRNSDDNVGGTATGLFDASEDAATVEIDVVELNVGRGIDANRIGIGELRLGGGVSLSATIANIGIGDGSSGTIDFGDRTFFIGNSGARRRQRDIRES